MSEVNKTSPENEQRRAFGIEALAEDHGVNVVSAVRSYGHLGPFRPRTGVDFRGVRLFDILLRQDQILCSSTVSRGDTSENLYGRWGVVIGSGTVEQAFPYDATTTVVEDEVTSIFLDRLQDVSPDEQIASAAPFRFESGHPMLDNMNYEESIKDNRCRAERDRHLARQGLLGSFHRQSFGA